LYQIGLIWTGTWQKNLASVEIQDPSISNYVSTISVIRYFIFNNKTGDTVSISGSLAVQGETAYTDISTICKNDKAYIDTEGDINNIQDSITNGFKLFLDLIFI